MKVRRPAKVLATKNTRALSWVCSRTKLQTRKALQRGCYRNLSIMRAIRMKLPSRSLTSKQTSQVMTATKLARNIRKLRAQRLNWAKRAVAVLLKDAILFWTQTLPTFLTLTAFVSKETQNRVMFQLTTKLWTPRQRPSTRAILMRAI